MRLKLIPREEKFLELFVADAENVLAGARLLQSLFQNYGERERLASQLIDLEHRGDEISHDIGHRLEKTLVTPFDREEIHALISRLEIIVRQCEQIVAAMRSLDDFKGLEQYWIEIHRLENDGDRIARRAIASLFGNGYDAVDIIKWKDVYSLLEETIDACEDVANVIERIFVKHA